MAVVCPVCGSKVESGNICLSCGFKLIEGTAQYSPLEASIPDIPLSQALSNVPKESYLHVLNGQNKGAVILLSGSCITLGRDPHSDVFLNDMTVSRNHAVITYDNNSYKISDCNSFNGLWVNNSLVEFKRLVNGDRIQLGSFTLMYKEE